MRPYVKLLWPLIIRPHRSTTHVDAACCYRPSSVVCRSVCHNSELGKNGSKEACIRWGALRRHLANTIESSMCCGDAAFLSNYFDLLLLLLIADCGPPGPLASHAPDVLPRLRACRQWFHRLRTHCAAVAVTARLLIRLDALFDHVANDRRRRRRSGNNHADVSLHVQPALPSGPPPPRSPLLALPISTEAFGAVSVARQHFK